MPERSVFRPLAELLRPVPLQTHEAHEALDVPEACAPDMSCGEGGSAIPEVSGEESVLGRLRAIEWFERARVRLLERFAEEVLARELLMKPVDIDTLARRALELFTEEKPREVRVAPADMLGLELAVPVRADPALRPGDLIVEVREGRLESPLAFRAQRIIAELAEEGDVEPLSTSFRLGA